MSKKTVPNRRAYRALRAELERRGYTQAFFANMIGLSAGAFNQKMTGKVDFTRDEMYTAVSALDLDVDYLSLLFPSDVFS